MELQLGNIIVHEADVALTDWLLAIECLVFAGLLLPYKVSTMRTLCIALFAALAAASLLGGAYHGFFPLKTETPGGWWLWMSTMLTIGAGSVVLLTLSAQLMQPAWTRRAFVAAIVLWAGYAYWVLNVDHRFLVAIFFYAPALAVLLGALMVRFLRTKQITLIFGLDAIIAMFVAAILQQMKIGLHPVYFNHNALYHLIQAMALASLYVALRGQVRRA